MNKLILLFLLVGGSLSLSAQMQPSESPLPSMKDGFYYSFIFCKAIREEGKLVRKKNLTDVEMVVVVGKDTIVQTNFSSPNGVVIENLYKKDAEYIFSCKGYETLRVKYTMDSRWKQFDVFLTPKKED